MNMTESMNTGDRLLRDEVMPDDIANVISVWTGIPSMKLLSTERERVLSMPDKLFYPVNTVTSIVVFEAKKQHPKFKILICHS